MKSMFKTFEEWNHLGFRIKKDSKAHYIKGQPYFMHEQVYKPKTKTSSGRGFGDGDNVEDFDLSIEYDWGLVQG